MSDSTRDVTVPQLLQPDRAPPAAISDADRVRAALRERTKANRRAREGKQCGWL